MPEIMTVKQFTHEQLETLSGVKRAVFGLITNNGTTKPTPTLGAAANRFFDFLDDAALWLQQVSVFAERCDEVVELNADPKAQGLSVVEGGGNADGSQQ
jgi:hypothetical protein